VQLETLHFFSFIPVMILLIKFYFGTSLIDSHYVFQILTAQTASSIYENQARCIYQFSKLYLFTFTNLKELALKFIFNYRSHPDTCPSTIYAMFFFSPPSQSCCLESSIKNINLLFVANS